MRVLNPFPAERVTESLRSNPIFGLEKEAIRRPKQSPNLVDFAASIAGERGYIEKTVGGNYNPIVFNDKYVFSPIRRRQKKYCNGDDQWKFMRVHSVAASTYVKEDIWTVNHHFS